MFVLSFSYFYSSHRTDSRNNWRYLVWEWNIFFSALLFFWPYVIALLFWIVGKIFEINHPKAKVKDVEDAQIIEEERYK